MDPSEHGRRAVGTEGCSGRRGAAAPSSAVQLAGTGLAGGPGGRGDLEGAEIRRAALRSGSSVEVGRQGQIQRGARVDRRRSRAQVVVAAGRIGEQRVAGDVPPPR